MAHTMIVCLEIDVAPHTRTHTKTFDVLVCWWWAKLVVGTRYKLAITSKVCYVKDFNNKDMKPGRNVVLIRLESVAR